MRSPATLLLTAFLSLLGLCLIRCSPGHSNTKETPTIDAKDKTVDSIPLILMGSFLSPVENLSQADVKKGLEDGSVLCTSDLDAWLVQSMRLKTKPSTVSLKAFDHTRDSLWLLTTLDSVDHRFLALRCDGVDFFTAPTRYPLWKRVEGRRDLGKEITSYVHTGVTALTRQAGVVLDRVGVDAYISGVKPFFDGVDLVHISNEVSMTDTCDYRTMKYRFATRSPHFEALKRLGADVVELTGNHNLDFGVTPYLKTLGWYESEGMRYFGGGRSPEEADRPLILTLKDGSRVAWVGFNQACPLKECADAGPGANRYDDTKAKDLLASVRRDKTVTYIVACVQFVESDSYAPMQRQREIARNLIDFGADVVIGSQAHQAQEIALYRDKVIFYGLGNFMFDQIHRIGVRQAFFLQSYIHRGRVIQFRPIYTFMGDDRRPAIAGDADRELIRRSILKRANFQGAAERDMQSAVVASEQNIQPPESR
jgi:poly-gamma-glutamate capsule biosynthesis protein CapA/YwtB (metallophosphatase superfamily)